LLLVSPAFLGSDYIGKHELSHYVGGGAGGAMPRKRAAPVALKPIRFDGAMDLKGLDRLQIFHDDEHPPKRHGPLPVDLAVAWSHP
jgi:hypothetical protein